MSYIARGSQEGMHLYMKALDDMSGATVEYVRGMMVVKTFQQTVDSFARFAHKYCLWSCMPMVLFTLFLNLPLVFIGLMTVIVFYYFPVDNMLILATDGLFKKLYQLQKENEAWHL